MKGYLKRLLALILILLLVFSAVGCSGPAQKEADVSATEPTADPSPESDATPEPTEIPGPQISMEKTVLVDNGRVTVTVTDYDPDSDLGPAFTLLLENKADEALYFTLRDVSVNDVMKDPLWGETVPAGETVESKLYWFPHDLEGIGVQYIEFVKGILWIYDADDYANDDTFEDLVTWSVNNVGMEGPSVVDVEYAGDLDEIVIFDTDVIAAVIKDFAPAGDPGPKLRLYLENHTDSVVLFYMESVTVNGVSLDPYWNQDVGKGKIAYSNCIWWQEDLEEHHVESIDTVTFTFAAIDYNTWERLEEVEMTISLEGSGAVLERSDEPFDEEETAPEDPITAGETSPAMAPAEP